MSNQKEYDNTNRGSLFINHDKKKLANTKDTSKWANAQGSINIFGVEFYLSAWTRTIQKGERKGERMQSLSVNPSDEEQGKKLKQAIDKYVLGSASSSPKSSEVKSDEFDDMDDDLPF